MYRKLNTIIFVNIVYIVGAVSCVSSKLNCEKYAGPLFSRQKYIKNAEPV
jgi:hypothetical protein